MSVGDIVLEADVDTTKADAKLDKTKLAAAEATRSAARTLRTVAQMGILTMQAFGGGVNMMYALGIEAVLLSIETIATVQAAFVAGTFGIGAAARLTVSSAAITAMWLQIATLKFGREEAARDVGQWVAVFRFGSYL